MLLSRPPKNNESYHFSAINKGIASGPDAAPPRTGNFYSQKGVSACPEVPIPSAVAAGGLPFISRKTKSQRRGLTKVRGITDQYVYRGLPQTSNPVSSLPIASPRRKKRTSQGFVKKDQNRNQDPPLGDQPLLKQLGQMARRYPKSATSFCGFQVQCGEARTVFLWPPWCIYKKNS